MTLEERIKPIRGASKAAMEAATAQWNRVAKPLHSLGLLEDALVLIAGMTESHKVDITKKALIIMCADNGVVEEGVTQTGQEVTEIVTENFTKGNSCVCIMAKQAGVSVCPVDIGVVGELSDTGLTHPLIREKIARGTKNFHKEPAMTKSEVLRAIEVGISIVERLKHEGYHIIATGEMGIGNTTTSSAVASVLLEENPQLMTGKGAGLSNEGLLRKRTVIEEAIRMHQPDKNDVIDVLSKVGGLDIAGLTGVFLGGAIYRLPIVIDGVISSVAALCAAAICPLAKDFMLASHVSAEPAGLLILNALKKTPMIQANMCLGEGTGAITLLPLLDMAVAIYDQMSTFEDNEIETYQPL